MAITIGAIIDPNNIPNLNHKIFNGVNNFDLVNPKNKKAMENIKKNIFKSFVSIVGHKLIIKKIMLKIIPKLLFELILILEFCDISYY